MPAGSTGFQGEDQILERTVAVVPERSRAHDTAKFGRGREHVHNAFS